MLINGCSHRIDTGGFKFSIYCKISFIIYHPPLIYNSWQKQQGKLSVRIFDNTWTAFIQYSHVQLLYDKYNQEYNRKEHFH